MDQTMELYLKDHDALHHDALHHDAIYHEGTCMLFDLENAIGKDAMNRFPRSLFRKCEYGVRPARRRATGWDQAGSGGIIAR